MNKPIIASDTGSAQKVAQSRQGSGGDAIMEIKDARVQKILDNKSELPLAEQSAYTAGFFATNCDLSNPDEQRAVLAAVKSASDLRNGDGTPFVLGVQYWLRRFRNDNGYDVPDSLLEMMTPSQPDKSDLSREEGWEHWPEEEEEGEFQESGEGGDEVDGRATPEESQAAAQKDSTQVADKNLLSAIPEEPIEWVNNPYIPVGEISLLDGDTGVGKSTFTYLQVRAITTGTDLSGRINGSDPRNVLWFNAEDPAGKVLRPRLSLMGAAIGRIVMPEGEFQRTKGQGFFIDRDFDSFEEWCIRYAPWLVIFNPVDDYLSEKADPRKASCVNPHLDRLKELARKRKFGLLLVRGTTKHTTQRANDRGAGSYKIAAKARSILMIDRNPKKDNVSVVFQTKNSFARRAAPQQFEIRPVSEDHAIGVWLGQVDDGVSEEILINPNYRGESEDMRDIFEFVTKERTQPVTVEEISRALGIPKDKVRKYCSRLTDRKMLRRVTRGTYAGF